MIGNFYNLTFQVILKHPDNFLMILWAYQSFSKCLQRNAKKEIREV